MSESSKKKDIQNPFVSLTWFDLESWAGTKILSRGKSYQKHAVAVVVEYLKALKEGDSLPEVDENDKWLSMIESGRKDSLEEGDDEYSDFDSEDLDKEEQVAGENRAHKNEIELEDFLRKKSQQDLVEILIQIADRHPDIKHEMKYDAIMSSSPASTLVKTVSKEIDLASSEPGWQDHWRNNGYTPDYSRVESGLQKLLDSGHADEVEKYVFYHDDLEITDLNSIS